MNIAKFSVLIAVIAFLTGCADFTPPMPEDILKRPLGTESVKIGMSKAEIRDLWGEPNQINTKTDEKAWGGAREEWVYIARYSKVPINAGYFSKTQKLYFDGDSLTNIVEE